MKKKFVFILLCSLFVTFQLNGQIKKSVLFIGNSYLSGWATSIQVATIATHFGDTLDYLEYVPGGYSLKSHYNDSYTRSLITTKAWDIVILQAASLESAYGPPYFDSLVVSYADSLHRVIKENDSCTTVLFFMTWGRKYGYSPACASDPAYCTFNSMTDRLRQNYLELGSMFGEVAPVGMSWKYARDHNPSIELFMPDGSHPGENGTYLAANVLYASIFRKSPVGGPFGVIDSLVADTLKQIAAHVVLDSLPTWYMYNDDPLASFSASLLSDSTYSFTNSSTSATSWWWNFGDSLSASNTSSNENPTHTFSGDGTYIITLIAMRGCLADTITDTITVTTVGIELIQSPEFSVWQTEDGNTLIIRSNAIHAGADFVLYSANGALVRQADVSTSPAEINIQGLPSGIYFAQLISRNSGAEKLPLSRKIWIRR